MIGFLQGTIAFIDAPYIFVNVGGVGYKVFVIQQVFSEGVRVGKNVMIFTYTHVKDDALELFGFLHPEDRKLFEQLISVSGVGPKTAISIFSVGKRADIVDAIMAGNVSFFLGVPRLGKKNAQKIIIELKSKFSNKTENDISLPDDTSEDVFQALKTIGFSAKEIQDALKHGKSGGSIEQRVKHALKYLGK